MRCTRPLRQLALHLIDDARQPIAHQSHASGTRSSLKPTQPFGVDACMNPDLKLLLDVLAAFWAVCSVAMALWARRA
jgi:hypothetical protein